MEDKQQWCNYHILIKFFFHHRSSFRVSAKQKIHPSIQFIYLLLTEHPFISRAPQIDALTNIVHFLYLFFSSPVWTLSLQVRIIDFPVHPAHALWFPLIRCGDRAVPDFLQRCALHPPSAVVSVWIMNHDTLFSWSWAVQGSFLLTGTPPFPYQSVNGWRCFVPLHYDAYRAIGCHRHNRRWPSLESVLLFAHFIV